VFLLIFKYDTRAVLLSINFNVKMVYWTTSNAVPFPKTISHNIRHLVFIFMYISRWIFFFKTKNRKYTQCCNMS